MQYAWKLGGIHKASAQEAGQLCERLASEGRLTAADLVEESKPLTAPLHGEFEWDDTEAAVKWREQQARVIINHIVIVKQEENPVPITRAFVKLGSSKPKYESITVVVNDEDKYQTLLSLARRELENFTKKYKGLKELDKIMDAIGMFLDSGASDE